MGKTRKAWYVAQINPNLEHCPFLKSKGNRVVTWVIVPGHTRQLPKTSGSGNGAKFPPWHHHTFPLRAQNHDTVTGFATTIFFFTMGFPHKGTGTRTPKGKCGHDCRAHLFPGHSHRTWLGLGSPSLPYQKITKNVFSSPRSGSLHFLKHKLQSQIRLFQC